MIKEEVNYLEYLSDGLAKLGIEVSTEKQIKMLEYMELVLEANKNINLTAITDRKEFIELHIIDSLTILSLLSDAKSLIDVGTGAGFPAVIIKIARDDLKVTMLDSLNKRLKFIEGATSKLGIEGLSYVHARAEDGAKKAELRESFDVCIARAVSNLAALCEYCIPFVALKGNFIAMKGKNVADEIKQASSGYKKLNAEKPILHSLNLPFSQSQRSILQYKKVGKTPSQYPRLPKQIKDKPLS